MFCSLAHCSALLCNSKTNVFAGAPPTCSPSSHQPWPTESTLKLRVQDPVRRQFRQPYTSALNQYYNQKHPLHLKEHTNIHHSNPTLHIITRFMTPFFGLSYCHYYEILELGPLTYNVSHGGGSTGVHPFSCNSPNLPAPDTQITNTDGRAICQTCVTRWVGRGRVGIKCCFNTHVRLIRPAIHKKSQQYDFEKNILMFMPN